MGKGRRDKAARRDKAERSSARARPVAGVADEVPILELEYPSLSAAEVAEGAAKRLAKSRRKFNGNGRATPSSKSFLAQSVGDFGQFDHASTSAIDQWLQSWRMPDASTGTPDVQSSAAVFVGLVETGGMPETSPLHKGPPFVTLTSHFVEVCHRISELFPAFAVLINGNPDVDLVHASRALFFQYLDPSQVPTDLVMSIVSGTRDVLFTTRTTSAAARWAIAHEMAHAVAGKKERHEAYEKAASLLPGLEADSWQPLRDKVPDLKASLERYRDEIACDYLANQYVLNSPFATDDLMTQVSGSLLALQTVIWDGWRQDGSAISQTHPSPSLRFQLTWLAWLETLNDPDTWVGRETPGQFGLDDFAYWLAFQKWAAGAYGVRREGAVWGSDIELVRDILSTHGPVVGAERIYVRNSEGLFRVSPRSR